MKTDWRQADLSPRFRAMLEYAEHLTIRPSETEHGEIQVLSQAGLSDRDILDLNLVVSFFNFINRVADGLGVQLEEGFPRTEAL
jgi:uncharacterized peroxidase-related enzyme